MSADKSWGSIGEDIRGAVEDALQTGDFRGFGDAVTESVKDVTVKVGQAVSGEVHASVNRTQQMSRETMERKRLREERESARQAQEALAASRKVPFVKVGWASSILLRVFGWVLAVPMAISTFVLFVGLFGPDRSVSTFVIDLFFFLLFAGMIHLGQTKKLRLRRAKKYIEQAGNNHYINISDLASFNSKPEAYILRDVKKMISEGIYPEGHLDAQENCLMLDNKIYGEYLKLEKERKALEKETGASAARASSSGSAAAASGQAKPDTKLEAMIAEGQECIRKLRDMNDNIPGEEISAKLFRLENLLKEIFEALREHPEQVSQMQKFMNYYLPTTLKLVGAYEDFDNMSTQGEEILEAKREIEKTLDTINSAFSELLGRMVRDTAYDVTTDAQVLQTMLAKEGLTGQDAFEKVPVLRQ